MRLAAASLLLLCGCFEQPGREDPPPGLDCEPTQTDGVSPTETVTYAPEHILCVKLRMAPEAFSKLRNETRDPITVLNTPCEATFTTPFNWYDTELTIDGVTVGDVGVRQKGFIGSLNPKKPSLKLKLDRNVPGQQIGDTERVTLNNNSTELTRLRTCLSYRLFERAGLVAPRCNLATVVVNDEPFGVYTHVEPVKKRFLRHHFGNDTGSLYEATLTDFDEDWLARFEAKTSDTDASFARLRAIAQALRVDDDARMLQRLGALIDVDAFVRFWAVEVALGHTDGYTGNRNNFFIYFDPDQQGRGIFIPWSVDLSLPGDDGLFKTDDLALYTRGSIAARFSRIPAMAERFEAELRRVTGEVWREDELLADVEAFSALVRTGQSDPDYDAALEQLREVIRTRPDELRALLDEGLPVREADIEDCFPFDAVPVQ